VFTLFAQKTETLQSLMFTGIEAPFFSFGCQRQEKDKRQRGKMTEKQAAGE